MLRESRNEKGAVMAKNFDDGVKGYITMSATVFVHFPINWRDQEDVRCELCPFFRHTSRSCALNQEICEYPDKFRGSRCPLEVVDDEPDV
jgi:hypothetical protein